MNELEGLPLSGGGSGYPQLLGIVPDYKHWFLMFSLGWQCESSYYWFSMLFGLYYAALMWIIYSNVLLFFLKNDIYDCSCISFSPLDNAAKTAKGYGILMRLMLVGDTGVGKTCLICRFAQDEFSPNHITTIGELCH